MSTTLPLWTSIFGAFLIAATVLSLALIGRPKTYRVGIWMLGGVVVTAVVAAFAFTV